MYHVKKGYNSLYTVCINFSSGLYPESCERGKVQTDQLVGHLVHDVGVVQAPALVLPPALDVDAGLLLKVGQVEVVPVVYNHQIG